MEKIFKVGDRVFDIRHGWGEVVDYLYGDYLIKFHPTNPMLYNEISMKMVSFTEYTLEGFSQERPEELPKKGDIVWTRGEFPSQWEIGHFFEKKGNNYLTYLSPSFQGWTNEGIEITTTNPYANEHTKEDEEAMVGNK